MVNNAPPYEMTLSLSVIDDLGLNLYSSIPAVLSEAVANAWDADATKVQIDINPTAKTIRIRDNGIGMDRNDVNEKYLAVGYRRREQNSATTPRGRHVMGRKGIGKLSLFSIAEVVTVETIKLSARGRAVTNGRNAFVMRTAEVRKAAAKNKPYYPEPAAVSSDLKRGTQILLSSLKITPTAATIPALRKRLARRFSIIGSSHSFVVEVDGTPIDTNDRDYFAQLQYVWSVGKDSKGYATLAKNAEKKEFIDGTIDATKGYEVSGWLGTFNEQRSMNPDEGDNTVTVLAWGKLLHEDLLADVRAGGLFTKYLIGELRADFLDLDGQVDIVTSDRQHVKEDDPRFRLLVDWFRSKPLAAVERSWGDWRRDTALDQALTLGAVREWYETLSKDNQRFAKQLFGKIGTLHLADNETKKELYRNAILAFEKLKLRESLTDIEKLPEDADFRVIQAVFNGIDEIEAVEYHLIAQSRLAVISAFSGLVDNAEKEKVLQKFLFDHLWLFHPSWERASTNSRIEEAVAKEFKALSRGLTDEERSGRIDIRYRTAAGKHIIIELKRSNVRVNIDDLMKQLRKYRAALTKVLKNFPDEPNVIEVISVLGTAPSGAGVTETQIIDTLKTLNARYVTYDTLIKEALDSYKDYLEANKRISRITRILDRL